MQHQSLDYAIPTADMLCTLETVADEAKFSASDALASIAQVAGALSLCWMIHIIT